VSKSLRVLAAGFATVVGTTVSRCGRLSALSGKWCTAKLWGPIDASVRPTSREGKDCPVSRLLRVLAAGFATVVSVAVACLAIASPASAGNVILHEYGTIVSQPEGLCVGVAGGNMSNGTAIILWPCNGHDDQAWEDVADHLGNHVFHNLQDFNKCLDITWWKPGPAFQPLRIRDCGFDTQNWRVDYVADSGAYTFTNVRYGFLMNEESNHCHGDQCVYQPQGTAVSLLPPPTVAFPPSVMWIY
jgi:hypothetical protein